MLSNSSKPSGLKSYIAILAYTQVLNHGAWSGPCTQGISNKCRLKWENKPNVAMKLVRNNIYIIIYIYIYNIISIYSR